MSPLLEIRNLGVHYITARGTRVNRAVDEVSFSLDAGETLGIVGESGSGKTTLALSLLRLLPTAARFVSGEVRFEGRDLLALSDKEMRKVRGQRIAMILQDPLASLNPLFTIGNQVAEPLRVHEHASRKSAWARARELLRSVKIPAPEARVKEYEGPCSARIRRISLRFSDRVSAVCTLLEHSLPRRRVECRPRCCPRRGRNASGSRQRWPGA